MAVNIAGDPTYGHAVDRWRLLLGRAAMENQAPAEFQAAKRFVALLPTPTSMFTSCIRTLRIAEYSLGKDNPQEFRELAVSSSSFLVSVSPTLKSVFYLAAMDHYPEQLKNLNPLNYRSLIGLFHPLEVTNILGIVYLYRHLRKRLDPEELDQITRKLLPHMEICSLVGGTVNHVGGPNGMLMGAIRFLAYAHFALADLESFRGLRRKNEKKCVLFDLKEEEKRWGCNHLHIASALLTNFGYGIIPSLGVGLANQVRPLSEYDELTAERLFCWRVAYTLTSTFHETGQAPAVGEDSDFFVPAEQAQELKKMVWNVLRDGSHISWLTKGKNDVPESARKILEIPGEGEAAPANQSTDQSINEMEEPIA